MSCPSAARDRVRDERGSTLVEVLIATAIMGISVVVLLVGTSTTFISSAQNRQSTTGAIVARDYAESLDLAVTASAWCSGSYTVSYTPPSGYSVGVAYSQCPAANVAQLQTAVITVTAPNGATETLRTVVREP